MRLLIYAHSIEMYELEIYYQHIMQGHGLLTPGKAVCGDLWHTSNMS